jgi:hypothetical protein
MPDLFDQIHAEATGAKPPAGDLFDQIHAQAQQSAEGTAEDPELQTHQFANPADEAAAKAHSQAVFKQTNALADAQHRQEQEQANTNQWAAEHPILNAANAFSGTVREGLMKGMAQIANLVPGDEHLTPEQMTNVYNKVGRQVQTETPFNPESTSGKIGSTTGQLAPIIAAPEAAPLTMLAQGASNRQQAIEQLQAGGAQLTPQQIRQYHGVGGALDVGLGLLAPGGRASGAVLEGLGANALPLVPRLATQALLGGAAQSPELAAYQAAQNLAAQQTVNPAQKLSEGVPQAAGQGLLLGGAGSLLHGLIGSPPSPPKEAPRAATPSPEAELNAGASGLKDYLAQRATEQQTDPALGRQLADTAQQSGQQEALREFQRVQESTDPDASANVLASLRKAHAAEVARRSGVKEPTAPAPAEASTEVPEHEFTQPTEANPEVSGKLENFTPVERRVANQPAPVEERRFPESEPTFQTPQDLVKFPEEKTAQPEAKPTPIFQEKTAAEEIQRRANQAAAERGIVPEQPSPRPSPPAPVSESPFEEAARKRLIAQSQEENLKRFAEPNMLQRTAGEHAATEEYGQQQKSVFGQAKSLFSRALTEEEGGMKREDLIGPGSIYHEEIKPKLEGAANLFAKGKEAAKSLFPMETKAGDEPAANIFRAHFAEGRQEIQKTAAKFEGARGAFDKMTVDDQHAFQQRMYDQEAQPTPELQKVADGMYDDAKYERDELVKLGHDAAAGWDDQKWNMLWVKDPAKAESLMTRVNRPGKVEGAGNFLKTKSLNDYQEGLDKGLVPKYDNPVEQRLAAKTASVKYRMGVQALKDLADNGTIRRLPKGQEIPEGYQEVPAGAKGPFKGLLQSAAPGEGTLILPDAAARVVTNVVNPSFFAPGTFRGGVKDFLQGFNNQATMALLGLSNFHVAKVAKENFVIQNARAFDLLAKGEGGKAAEAAGRAVNPVSLIGRGKTIQDQMLGMRSATPEEAARNAAMIQGGFSAKSDSGYETNFRKKLSKALQDGGIQGMIRAAVYTPFAANEALGTEGVFKYVQHTKLSIGGDMTADWLRQNPDATQAQIREHVGQISDHMDNLLGLMEKDNLFWNRTARDLATLSTLSVGWNYGSARELGGGLVDLGKGLGNVATTGKWGDVPTRRINYLATMAVTSAAVGAITTYLATGEGPKELKDYIFPKVGTKDREGHDVRYNPGLYTSDYYDFLTHPVNTLAAKGSPLIHAATDLAKNEDYRKRPIYSDNDHVKAAVDIAKYLGKTNMPMNVQQMIQAMEQGGSSSKSNVEKFVLPTLGVKHAPISQSESSAELEARSITGATSRVSKQTEEHAAAISRLTNAYRDKEDPTQAIADAKAAGATQKDIHDAFHRSKQPGGLSGLLKSSEVDVRSLMSRVYPKMSDEEKQVNDPIIRKRILDANVPLSEKRGYIEKLGAK